jgi:hypothetical protein
MNEKSQELMFSAAKTVLQAPEVLDYPWSGITILFSLPEEDESHFSVVGYRFNGPEWSGFVPENFDEFGEIMLGFRKESQIPNDKPWCACLMQISREGMKLVCDLEYDDPARWDVTPNNLETRVEELRPKGA